MPCACTGAFVLFITQHVTVTGIRLSPVGSGGRDHARAQRGDAGSLGGGGHGHAQSGVRGRARGGGAALRGASTATSRPTTGANGCLPRGPTTGNGAARPVRAASPAAAAPFSASVATAMSDDIDDADATTIAALTAAEAACGNAADGSADAAAATAAPTAPSGARPVRAAGVVAAAVLAAGAAADGDRGAAARGDRRASNHHRGGSGGGRACVADATFCGVGRPLPSQRLAPAGVRGPVSFDATPVSQGLFCVRICLLVPSTRRLNLAARRRGSARRRGGAAAC